MPITVAVLVGLLSQVHVALPPAGQYGAGTVFLPTDHSARAHVRQAIERVIAEEGQRLLGWRHVPVEDAHLGPAASATRPRVVTIPAF